MFSTPVSCLLRTTRVQLSTETKKKSEMSHSSTTSIIRSGQNDVYNSDFLKIGWNLDESDEAYDLLLSGLTVMTDKIQKQKLVHGNVHSTVLCQGWRKVWLHQLGRKKG